MSFIGAGIGYRRAHHAALLAGEGPPVLEIMPDHFFADPDALAPLAQRYRLVFHDIGLSLGTVDDAASSRARLARIKPLVRDASPLLFTEHLALTRSPSGIDLGHLAPLWRTPELLDHVVDRVRAVEDVLGLPVALENIAAPFEIPGAFSEPEFFARLSERSGCGLLLDLTNLLHDARNAGQDPRARMREYPLEAVRQVHLAGGFRDRRGVWIDSHSEPVEDEAFGLLAELRTAAPQLRCIIIERDHKLGALGQLVAEAKRAERAWEERA
jgi:uncharacterized protein (UPF0276 family)